jgi:hypothetical protein
MRLALLRMYSKRTVDEREFGSGLQAILKIEGRTARVPRD